MPIACDPAATFDVILSNDVDKDEPRPVFEFRYLTGRQWKNYANACDDFDNAETGPDKLDCCFAAVRLGMVGWRNIYIGSSDERLAFDLDKIEDLLTPEEAVELMQAGLGNRASAEDKKKLGSPSDSSTELSATAAPDQTNAETNPVSPALSSMTPSESS